jgi:hypothetical protein
MGRIKSMHGEMRNAYKILLGKPNGKVSRKLRSRRKINIKMDLGRGCEDAYRSQMGQNGVQWRYLVSKVMKFRTP